MQESKGRAEEKGSDEGSEEQEYVPAVMKPLSVLFGTRSIESVVEKSGGLLSYEEYRSLDKPVEADDFEEESLLYVSSPCLNGRRPSKHSRSEAASLSSSGKAKTKTKAKTKAKTTKGVAKVRLLSFADEEESEESVVKSACPKDPTVGTDFLPDRERDAAAAEERRRLKREEKAALEREKKEKLKLCYKYWDGYGHRYDLVVEKGMTISHCLLLAAKQLAPKFQDLKDIHPADLMFVKEDSIIPQELTFFDLIKSGANGKSGPLWKFGELVNLDLKAENIMVPLLEVDPAVICLRKWYYRYKEDPPANAWEPYDPFSKNQFVAKPTYVPETYLRINKYRQNARDPMEPPPRRR